MVAPNPHTSTRPRSRHYRHLGPYVSGLATVFATMVLTLLLTKRALIVGHPVPEGVAQRPLYPLYSSAGTIPQNVAVRVPDPSLSWSVWVIENGPHYIATRLAEPLVFVPLVALGVVSLLAQRRTS